MVSPSLEACFLQISAILSLQSAKLMKLAFGNFNITNFQMLKLPQNCVYIRYVLKLKFWIWRNFQLIWLNFRKTDILKQNDFLMYHFQIKIFKARLKDVEENESKLNNQKDWNDIGGAKNGR